MITPADIMRATWAALPGRYGKSVVVAALADLAVLRGMNPTAVIVDDFYVANANLASETKVPVGLIHLAMREVEEPRRYIVKGPPKRTGGKRRRNPDRWT